MNRLWPAIVVCTLLVPGGVAFAAEVAPVATVAIVRPPGPSPELAEMLSRLQGELSSLRLSASLADRPPARGRAGADWPAWLEEVTAAYAAVAVVDIVGDEAPVAIDVWVVKTAPRRFEVTRIAMEDGGTNPVERLAIRAVEALRAGLLEEDWASRHRPPAGVPAPEPAAQVQASPTPRHDRRFGVAIGAGALMSLDGVGPAVLPLLTLGWAARPWLVLQATVAGLGSRASVETTAGNAQVAQQYALLGVGLRRHPDRRLWPFIGVAAGGLRSAIEGEDGPAAAGRSAVRWSLLFDANLGAGLRLYRGYDLTLAAHVQIAAPYVAIHLADSVGATTGRPNLLATLTLGAWR